jgi:hypothetical protein
MSIKYNLQKLKFESSYQEFIEVEIIQSCLNYPVSVKIIYLSKSLIAF